VSTTVDTSPLPALVILLRALKLPTIAQHAEEVSMLAERGAGASCGTCITSSNSSSTSVGGAASSAICGRRRQREMLSALGTI